MGATVSFVQHAKRVFLIITFILTKQNFGHRIRWSDVKKLVSEAAKFKYSNCKMIKLLGRIPAEIE